MNKVLIATFLLCILRGHAQDIIQLKQIDSLVTVTNYANFYTQQDSIIQDYPKLGLSMKTYLTQVRDQQELKKFVNKVYVNREDNGVKTQSFASISFYYNHNKLIKVEDYGWEGKREFHDDWYYASGKPFYYTLQSEAAADRANELLTMSDAMIKKSQGMNPK